MYEGVLGHTRTILCSLTNKEMSVVRTSGS